MATWPTPSVDDDGSGTTGTVLSDAFFDQIKAYIDDSIAVIVGPWTDVPYNAGNFGASGSMTWTVDAGDVLMNRYLRLGKTVIWSVYLFTTTIGGTASNQLRINLPIVAATAAKTQFNAAATYIGDGGANVPGIIDTGGGTYITISKQNLANYTIAANGCHLAFTLILEIQ